MQEEEKKKGKEKKKKRKTRTYYHSICDIFIGHVSWKQRLVANYKQMRLRSIKQK